MGGRNMIEWQFIEGSKKQAALSCWKHYVISHRPECYTVSYRPPNEHHHVGQYPTLEEAKLQAEDHDFKISSLTI